MTVDIKELYVFSSKNKKAIENSKKCGCFTCCNLIEARKVKEYTEELDANMTGICPMCNTDTLIPDSKAPNITVEILNRMYDEFVS